MTRPYSISESHKKGGWGKEQSKLTRLHSYRRKHFHRGTPWSHNQCESTWPKRPENSNKLGETFRILITNHACHQRWEHHFHNKNHLYLILHKWYWCIYLSIHCTIYLQHNVNDRNIGVSVLNVCSDNYTFTTTKVYRVNVDCQHKFYTFAKSLPKSYFWINDLFYLRKWH